MSTYDLAGTTAAQRLTFGVNSRFPVWSGDGEQIAFQSDRERDHAIYTQRVDGGDAVRLTGPEADVVHVPESWSPDGKVLLYTATKDDLSSLRAVSVADRTATRFDNATGSSLPTDAEFSPNGRWVAYQIGRKPVLEGTTYVEPYPPTGPLYEIGAGGRPLWSRDGKQLFITSGVSRFQAVTVNTEPAFSSTPPESVPRPFGIADPTLPRPYDMMGDGRFLVVRTAEENAEPSNATPQLRVVLNWFEELKRLAPAP